MAKHLSNTDVEAIINIIDGWSIKKITWDEICEACIGVVGKKPTRQSLNAHDDIKNAYIAKKKGLQVQGVREPLPANLKSAADRIKNMESKINRLKKQNDQLLQQFIVWQYNAYKYGLEERQLNEPMPRIDRERTEEQ